MSDLEKIDNRFTVENVSILKTLDEIQDNGRDETNYVVATDEYIKALARKNENIYFPYSLLAEKHRKGRVFVYFELEALPFFRTFTHIVKSETHPRGVFRFRRTINRGNIHSLIAEELYVFSSLFGEPKDIHIKKTDSSKVPRHTIIMINFGDGTMGHVEYTVGNQEKIELEWSGIKNIIEFDSDQMKPVIQKDNTLFPFIYSIDAILSSARVLEEKMVLRLDYFQKLLDGGAQK